MSVPTRMTAYSHSRLETFENCPLKYKLRYIDRITTDEQSIEAFMGTRVHGALEKLYRDARMSKLDTLEELVSFYKAQWQKDWHDQVTITKEGLRPENYLETGRRCIARYHERFSPFDAGSPVWIEEQVRFEVGGFRMTGVVDRMDRMPDGSLEIHDYKTGGRLPGQAEMDTDRQLALYNLAVRDRWKDAGDVKLVWHFLQFGTELRSSRTPQELKGAAAACASLIKTIEGTAEFRPAPGPLCDWCGYWEHCPEKKHLVKIGSLPPAEAAAEDGFALVNEYARLKGEERRISAGAETLRERLLEYSKRENATRIRGSTAAVTVRTQEAAFLPGRPADGPAYEELVNALKQAGAWERYSVADSKALLEALRQGKLEPALARKLEPLVQKRTSQIVRLGRLKEEED